jgi:hypothetical protein
LIAAAMTDAPSSPIQFPDQLDLFAVAMQLRSNFVNVRKSSISAAMALTPSTPIQVSDLSDPLVQHLPLRSNARIAERPLIAAATARIPFNLIPFPEKSNSLKQSCRSDPTSPLPQVARLPWQWRTPPYLQFHFLKCYHQNLRGLQTAEEQSFYGSLSLNCCGNGCDAVVSNPISCHAVKKMA